MTEWKAFLSALAFLVQAWQASREWAMRQAVLDAATRRGWSRWNLLMMEGGNKCDF